jgi:hypothetical protein
MPLPPTLVWTLGTIGAAIVAKLVVKEWHRVNADLERAKTTPVTEPDRHALPKLRRDPASGEYRIT